MTNQKENGRICIEIENVRIFVSFDDGFFNLEKTRPLFHNHNRYEFHLALQGATRIETDRGTFIMEETEGYLLSPGIMHNCILLAKASVKSSFWFTFEKIKKNTERDVYALFLKAFSDINGIKKIDQADKYITNLKQIILEFYSQDLFQADKIKSRFSLIMMQLAEELLPESKQNKGLLQSEESLAGEEKNLRRIIIEEYINRNYNKDISLKHLASVLYLSPKQVSRIFMSEFGTSFITYVTKFRINVATRYLRQTELPVKKIATLVGYKSYNGFYKPFLTYIGQTPDVYRKRARK